MLLSLAACTGGGNTPSGAAQTVAPTAVTVRVSPASATLESGAVLRLVATVEGSAQTGVTWTATAGTVRSDGEFVAPVVTDPLAVTVRATSVADATRSATALIQITPKVPVSVTLSPGQATVQTGASLRFAAEVKGLANPAVLWSSTGGSITQDGLFTAPSVPGRITVVATPAGDLTRRASAEVTVVAAPPVVSVEVLPGQANLPAGGELAFRAMVGGTANTAVTWSCSAGSITPQGVFTAPATAGPVTLTAQSVADPSRRGSATVNVFVPVAVSLSPASVILRQQDTQVFTATVTGSDNPRVSWSTTGGTITPEGLYTAPSASGTFTVTARSVADPSKAATATVVVTSRVGVSISPGTVNLNAGGSQAFSATVTGTANPAVTWSASPGRITADGIFTAPLTPGLCTVRATSVADPTQWASATVNVSVPCASGIPASVPPSVLQAVLSGHALTGATSDDYLRATLATLDAQRTALDPAVVALFNLNPDGTAKGDGSSLTSLNWYPTHDSCLLGATFGLNAEVLVSNTTATGGQAPAKGLAVAGQLPGAGGRYLFMGSNPMWSRGNAQMDRFMVNAIHWLTRKPVGSDLKVAIVYVVNDTSAYFPYEGKIRTWLTAMFGSKVTFNAVDALDADPGKVLTEGYDLVITDGELLSTQDVITCFNGLKAVAEAGKPLLYLKADGDLDAMGTQLFNLFQVKYLGDNRYSDYSISGLDGQTMVGRLPDNLASIKETLTRLLSGVFDFGLGTWQASTTETAAYNTQFGNGANAVRQMMTGFDAAGLDLFSECGREVPKLLALLGDRLRQDITFPYKTATSSPKAFLRAYFADHLVYTCRSLSPAQADLGTFSREDFSAVVPVTRTVNMVSRPNFQPTGAYALPGRTVRVTRLDSNPVTTTLCLNSLRSSSTKEWEDAWAGGYARPKFIKQQSLPLNPGRTLTFTSPYGGPIQLNFNAKDVPVQVRFENVGEHPFWASAADDTSFAREIAASQFDWVEVATPGFVMHSKFDRFKAKTMTGLWNTPARLGAAVQRYTYNFTHVLAGFQGDGIDKEPEVYGWAMAHGITPPTTNVVKHMNADVATCGAGCSGNPYDAGWAFSPIGHGDLHELGHGMQSGRFLLNHDGKTYDGHAATNFYAYYAQSRYYDDTGLHPGCQGMPYDTIFGQLQEAYRNGDRVGTFSTAMDATFGAAMNIYNTYAFYIQYMMQVRDKGLLNNGWHMIGRIHVLDRAVAAADGDQATWDREKGKWGFDRIAFADLATLTRNDWMAIAMSYATGLDCRDYMAMWGLKIGAAADAQVASYGFPAAERVFYVMGDSGWPDGALSTRVDRFIRLAVDGTTPWPLDSTMKVSKTTYTTAETVTVTFTDLYGDDKDWIGIYPATEEPSPTTTALQRKSLNGAKTGTMTFTGLPAGTYKAYLCVNDDDVAIGSVSFTVK